MVREIVHCQVGQCGNQIGQEFWKTICNEHKVDKDGKFTGEDGNATDQARLDKIDVYFNQTDKSKFVPRAVMVDLEPGVLDMVKASPMGKIFKPDNLIFGCSGSHGHWGSAHVTEGAELVDEAVDVIRKEMESCDCPQGFQLTHSLGGGTGSALGSLLLLKFRDNYPDRITTTYSVYPSPKVSDIVVEPYNATLSIHQLLENSDETFVIDNEALYNISHNILKQKNAKYSELNWVISLVMSGITSSLRFSGKLNGDLRKLGTNLVPFPRLHFLSISQAPLFCEQDANHVKISLEEICSQMWSSRNCLASMKPEDGKYLSASCGFRGNIATHEVDDQLAKIQQKLYDDFVTWIPNNIKSSVINVARDDVAMSGTFVANTTAVKTVFQRISAQFAKLYKRKAFLHWYKGEGMDEMEFEEADKNVRDLCTEYQDKQDAVVDDEEEDDDDVLEDDIESLDSQQD